MRATLALLLAAASFATFTVAAQAQDSDRAQKAMARFDEKFTEADTDHDGKLTQAEAKAKMPRVSEHFSEIDTDKDGTVSKQEIATYMQGKMAERKASK